MQHKIPTFVIALVLATATLFSCDGDNQQAEVVSADLLVAGNAIEVSGGASKDTIHVEANCDWTVTTQDSWIHIINPRAGRGSGSQELVLDVDASTLATERTGKLTVRSTDGIERIITMTQRAGEVKLEPLPNTLTFTYDGGDQTLTVTSNAQWTATCTATWLTINGENEISGSGDQNLTVHANTNSNSGSLNGTIIFRDLDNQIDPIIVTVELGGRIPILYVSEPYNIPATGGSSSLEVRSNFNWMMTISCEPRGESAWAYFDGTEKRQSFDGNANSVAQIVNVTIEPNVTETERVVRLKVQTISDSGNNLTEERAITQAAGTRPEVNNVSYSDITHTTATISFTQRSTTLPTSECGVIYSLSADNVPNGIRVRGAVEDAVNVNLTNLAPKTRYYVCTYATNAVGTTYSDAVSFQTRGVPGREDNEEPTMGN